MSDTYIQNLFAERIGGRQYGKSTAIYKFETGTGYEIRPVRTFVPGELK